MRSPFPPFYFSRSPDDQFSLCFFPYLFLRSTIIFSISSSKKHKSASVHFCACLKKHESAFWFWTDLALPISPKAVCRVQEGFGQSANHTLPFFLWKKNPSAMQKYSVGQLIIFITTVAPTVSEPATSSSLTWVELPIFLVSLITAHFTQKRT